MAPQAAAAWAAGGPLLALWLQARCVGSSHQPTLYSPRSPDLARLALRLSLRHPAGWTDPTRRASSRATGRRRSWCRTSACWASRPPSRTTRSTSTGKPAARRRATSGRTPSTASGAAGCVQSVRSSLSRARHRAIAAAPRSRSRRCLTAAAVTAAVAGRDARQGRRGNRCGDNQRSNRQRLPAAGAAGLLAAVKVVGRPRRCGGDHQAHGRDEHVRRACLSLPACVAVLAQSPAWR